MDIHVVSDKCIKIILKKTVKGKIVPIAIEVFGYYKQKADEMKLKKGDKIRGTLYLKSKLWNGKWYTDVYFEDVERIEDKPKAPAPAPLFDDPSLSFIKDNNSIIDKETGQVLL